MRNTSSFSKILDAANKMKEYGGSSNSDDSKFWKMEADKAGNGSATIRFLPGKTEDDLPFTKIYNHGFKGPAGKWFIENCPTTIGDDCPVCAANGELWNSGNEKDKDVVRARKRKLGFIANIMVIEDTTNPDNEGKVFLFKFGKKIFDKITDVMQPAADELDDEENPVEAINPFDILEGANFRLNMRRVEGFANFDKSKFMKPKALNVDWDEISDQLHDLSHFTAKDNFKTYEALETKMKQILSGVQRPIVKDNGFDEADDDNAPQDEEAQKPAAKTKPKAAPKAPAVSDDDDDDDMAYFKNLAKD